MSLEHGRRETAAMEELQSGPAGLGHRIDVKPDWLAWLAGPETEQAGAEQAGGVPAGADPAKTPPMQSGHTGTEETMNGTPFVKGAGDANSVALNDVAQGNLGDCYFLALLGAIARKRPDFIKGMIEDHKDGTYSVTFQQYQGISGFFGSRTGMKVKVDSKFWTDGKGTPNYAKTGDVGTGGPELWVMIIEKAWAALNGGYENILGGNTKKDNARAAVTGKNADEYIPSDLSASDLLSKVKAHFTEKDLPVTFGSHVSGNPATETKMQQGGVVMDHEYVLDSISGDTMNLYNPWGGSTPGLSADAEFIRKHFRLMRLINL
jgi:hypothetical protein